MFYLICVYYVDCPPFPHFLSNLAPSARLLSPTVTSIGLLFSPRLSSFIPSSAQIILSNGVLLSNTLNYYYLYLDIGSILEVLPSSLEMY